MYKTNEQSRLQNIRIEICKQNYNQVRLVLAVIADTKQARCNQQVSKISLATFDFNKYLTIRQLSHVTSYNIGKNVPRFSYFAIISLTYKLVKKVAKYEELGNKEFLDF